MKYLPTIDSPSDLKKLPIEALPQVCEELRTFIIEALSHNPGHLGSSLGVIELTVALHYVFDTPDDRIVWDVGHQAYAHKILTHRRDRFSTNRQFKGLAPFPTPLESEYDCNVCGHASNSISVALGMDIASQGKRRVVAVIGDGAMTGGLAFEGLNNASMLPNDMLIVLNDNNMAIDPIKGGFTQYLLDITTSSLYNRWRWRAYQLAVKTGWMDEKKKQQVMRRHNNIKSILTQQPNNIFQALNFRYFGPADGHDVVSLVKILQEIKHHKGPKVLHITTQKGKGYAPAEQDQTVWHAPGEFCVATGERKADAPSSLSRPKLWQEVFGECLLALAREDKSVVGVTPAMPSGCSMSIMQKVFPDRVFDVGIAEGHAVTFSAGLAKEGMHVYCNIYSSFLQRAYDNIIHDVAIARLPVILCIDRAGIVGNDGATHHGLLDLAYLRPIPHLSICAPRTATDLEQMMHIAPSLAAPVAIRYPRGKADFDTTPVPAVAYGKAVCLRPGKRVAVLSIGAIGNAMSQAITMAEATLSAKSPDTACATDASCVFAHYDMRWLKPLDEQVLHHVGQTFDTVVTVEDGVIDGGLGSAVLEFMADHGYHPRVVRLGVRDQFVEHGSTQQLYQLLHLDPQGLCESLLQVLAK